MLLQLAATKGKKGQVLEVLHDDARVKVQVLIGKTALRQHRQPGGIDMKPRYISNAAHIDPESGSATRVGISVIGGKKVRGLSLAWHRLR